jgi:alkanesulfonate monooxygenase SsuD/methylene tetrahydromethanopterin reductase-like flavin-dependent oxidoreductase (luciferase family)
MDLRVFTEPQQGATYDDLLAGRAGTETSRLRAFFRSDHYLAMGADGPPGPSDAWTTLAGAGARHLHDPARHPHDVGDLPAPGPLAITVANVDAMSGGRVELGIGAGWFEPSTRRTAPVPATGERFDRFESSSPS